MKTREWFHKAEQFVRSYTGGVAGSDLQRLFDQDARQAYAVVTREHDPEEEPSDSTWRFLYRARILFLSLSYRLAPPRRALFVACIVLAAWSLVETVMGRATVVPATILAVLAVAGLVFLLLLELADRVAVRDELEVARELQRELLPADSPGVDGYEFAFSYRTANTIGGDYYDFLELDDGRLVLVIGDASGHGIAAGLLMAVASSTLRLAFDDGDDPAAAADLINRALWRTGGRRAFMTLFCAVLEPATGRLRCVSAGHPYPMIRRSDGTIEEIGTGSLPLGIRKDVELPRCEAAIAPGDAVLLYTDGMPETVNATGEAFGFERLRRSLESGGPGHAIHDRIVAEVDRFRGDEPVHDDRSLVVIRRMRPLPGPA
jgi:serine phosphatase RsbU (regulator of sigma subunit)